jgi:hypothetical protein
VYLHGFTAISQKYMIEFEGETIEWPCTFAEDTVTLHYEALDKDDYADILTYIAANEAEHKAICQNCNITWKVDYDPCASGHTWDAGKVTTAATCTKTGVKTYTCSVCGETKTEDIPVVAHAWDAGKVTTAATCTKAGVKTYTCSAGGETKTEEIAATGHSFDYTKGTVTKAATSTQTGTVVYSCANCDDTQTQVIPVNKYPDVTDTNQYYYVPALWAASEGLVKGMDDGSFNPSGDATRAQMITILWRAAGEPEPTSTVNPFTDVVDTEYTHWYYKAVLWGVEQGIIHGMTATTFEPNTVCSRAMILTMLYRAEGEPDAGDDNPFVDVKDTASTNWYYDAVLWAAENGVANGMDATHFVPATECARAAMVTFLYRNAMR